MGINEDSINNVKTQSIDDLTNDYTKNGVGIYIPQHLASSSENQMGYLSSNNMAAKNVALMIKYKDASHLTEKELSNFFSE